MSQYPGQWGPGGQPQSYPPQQGQPGYSPTGPQGGPTSGYPPQGAQPQGYQQGAPTQGYQPGSPQGYQQDAPTQGYQQGVPQAGGYAPQGGVYGQPPGYGQAGYGAPRYGTGQGTAGSYAQQPPGSYQSGGRPPVKKSPGLIIGIVVAAVVLLVAIGGIFIALSGGGERPTSTITPAPPTTQPTEPPTPEPSGPASQPGSPSTAPTQPTGETIDLGSGIKLAPAPGWRVQDQAASVASLTNGQGVFYGRQQQLDKGTNATQSCDAFNQAALETATNTEFGEPEARDVGSDKLSAAVCAATYTDSSRGQSVQVFVSTMVSVRKSDGLTVVGTLLFVKNTDEQTKTDASAMMSSMLNSQVS